MSNGSAQMLILAQAEPAGGLAADEGSATSEQSLAAPPAAGAAGDLQEGTVADEHGGGAHFPPFDVSTFGSQLLWLALTFGALYLLMARVALPRIGEILEIRRDRIESDLAEAERLRQRTDQAIAAYEAALAEARQRAHQIAEQTRAEIRAEIEEKRAKAEADLVAKLAAAESGIAETKDEALSHIEEIAADTATSLVSQLLGRVPAKSIKEAVKVAAKEH